MLGFGISDYILTPFRAYFMHINARHHSVALIETGKQDLHHLMVELYSLDDVGQGYDIALGEPERIATTLGRHPNDCVTSFYLNSPSGFMLEYGWGGKEVTPGSGRRPRLRLAQACGVMTAHGCPRNSARGAGMRLKAARDGMREPVQVIAGNFQPMQGVCPWWDAAKQAS